MSKCITIRNAKTGHYVARLPLFCGWGAIHEALTIYFADRPTLNYLWIRIEDKLYSIARLDDAELPAIEIEAYS